MILPCNGNMTGRTVGGVTYTLVYDAENRLQQEDQPLCLRVLV